MTLSHQTWEGQWFNPNLRWPTNVSALPRPKTLPLVITTQYHYNIPYNMTRISRCLMLEQALSKLERAEDREKKNVWHLILGRKPFNYDHLCETLIFFWSLHWVILRESCAWPCTFKQQPVTNQSLLDNRHCNISCSLYITQTGNERAPLVAWMRAL